MPVTVVQERVIPPSIESLDVIGRDYADLFVARTAAATTTNAERWARLAIEPAPAAGRFLAWQILCALRLDTERPAAEHVAGWTITGQDEHWIRLDARSWFMRANMIFLTEPGRVCFATLVRYEHPAGRAIWGGPVSAIHRRVAPSFLGGAVARVTRPRQQG